MIDKIQSAVDEIMKAKNKLSEIPNLRDCPRSSLSQAENRLEEIERHLLAALNMLKEQTIQP